MDPNAAWKLSECFTSSEDRNLESSQRRSDKGMKFGRLGI